MIHTFRQIYFTLQKENNRFLNESVIKEYLCFVGNFDEYEKFNYFLNKTSVKLEEAGYILEEEVPEKKAFTSTKKTTINYTMAALDAFSNKTVASFVKKDLDDDFTAYLEKQLPKDLPGFVNQIKDYFKDIIVNGRDITFRVAVAADAAINLSDEYNEAGDTYTDWIREWVKTHAKNGTASLNRNTAKELFYTSVRITNNAEDGTQYNAYDFANNFRKDFIKNFSLRCTNSTQGLGDAYVIIK